MNLASAERVYSCSTLLSTWCSGAQHGSQHGGGIYQTQTIAGSSKFNYELLLNLKQPPVTTVKPPLSREEILTPSPTLNPKKSFVEPLGESPCCSLANSWCLPFHTFLLFQYIGLPEGLYCVEGFLRVHTARM
jgi:hypothetical protein